MKLWLMFILAILVRGCDFLLRGLRSFRFSCVRRRTPKLDPHKRQTPRPRTRKSGCSLIVLLCKRDGGGVAFLGQ